MTLREAWRRYRTQERAEYGHLADRFDMGFPHLVRYVAAFKGWNTALICAAAGVALTLLVVAVVVAGPVAVVFVTDRTAQVVIALVSTLVAMVAGDIVLRRKPWRGPLSVAGIAGSYRVVDTLGLHYIVAPAHVFRAKHALLSEGFPYVNAGSDYVEPVCALQPGEGLDQAEAQRRAERALAAAGIDARLGGWSQS